MSSLVPNFCDKSTTIVNAMNTVKAIDPNVAKTHTALFDTWFPIEQLPIPPAIAPDIAKIAAEVKLPPEVKISQIGFANTQDDGDKFLRRHLLM